MPDKYTQDELRGMVKSPGWELDAGDDAKDKPVVGTLEEVLHVAHKQREAGEKPGLIRQIETAIELDLIQIEELWYALGLPR
ncbi:MAG: hypothetical protein ABSD74_06710 [Rhizomicrobium sp.]|jgi:hypothetical protein